MNKTKRNLCICLLCVILTCFMAIVAGCEELPDSSANPPQSSTGGEVSEYTVSFELCTELSTNKALPRKVSAGARIEQPQIFVMGDNPENWEIEGWYTDREYTEKWNFNIDEVESDLILYAKWKSDPRCLVRFFAGSDEEPTYTENVKLGLRVAECDDKFTGYEVLGYYSSPDFAEGTEFNFDNAITQPTDIYVKLSDYIYFTPRYLSTFNGTLAKATVAANGESVDVEYAQGDSYLWLRGLDYALNGNELIEIVCKVKNASRVDIYWHGSHSDGTLVLDQADFNASLLNAGAKSHYSEITTDEDGWTHIVFDLSRPRAYVEGAIGAPLTDVAFLNGFRIQLDGKTADPAVLTIKYVKGQQKPQVTGYPVNYYVNGALRKTDDVDSGEKAVRPADSELITGRQILGFYTSKDFAEGTEFDFNTGINNETNLYAKLSDYVYFDGAMLNEFSCLAGASLTLNADGTVSMKGGNGAFIYTKSISLAMNNTNILEVRAKVNLSGGILSVMPFGSYVLNGTPGKSTDFGQDYLNLATQGCTITEDSDGFVVIRYDFAYTANGEAAKDFAYTVLNGLRFNIYGGSADTNEVVIDYVKSLPYPEEDNKKVNYYLGSQLKHTTTVKNGNCALRVADDKIAFGRQVVGYYTDEALTDEYDFATPVSADLDLYVKLSDYVYFNGAMLNEFTCVEAMLTLNADGTVSMKGGNGAFIFTKSISLAMNNTNILEVRAKVNLSGGILSVMPFGTYVLNGVAGEYTDFGLDYLNLTTQGCTITEDSDGFVIIRYDFAYTANGEAAKDFAFTVLNGLRLNIYGGSADTNEVVIDYVKSLPYPDPEDCEIKYYLGSEVKGSEVVKQGEAINGIADEAVAFGRQIVGYYTDEALTNEYDINAEVTGNLNLYVKLSDYVYFNGAMLNEFSCLAGASLTLNADGTVSMKGGNGAFIFAKSISLAMNNTNILEVRAKVNLSGGILSVMPFGTYVLNGVAGEYTDFGLDYLNLTTQGCTITEDSDGFVIIRYDFAYTANEQPAADFAFTVLNGLRFNIYGGSADTNEVVIDYIKTV